MMPRAVLGGLLGGIAMWIIGFIFWGRRSNIWRGPRPAMPRARRSRRHWHSSWRRQAPEPIRFPGPTPRPERSFTGRGRWRWCCSTTAALRRWIPCTDQGVILGIVCSILLAFALARVTAGWSFGGRLTVVGLFALAITTYPSSVSRSSTMPLGLFRLSVDQRDRRWLAAGAAIAWMLPKPVVVAPVVEPVDPPTV
ncbi:hypothetical protein DdX_20441 [Ditylenchus destructor]|uniref:Uncharacterized protein n=1 Tax=Ditylenchus destructor TaxID=166010 RepID=A0AAD4MKR2_9BILA|nr:hypothetical protein DdX_20441 [Ditylenchus destructor]